MKMNINTAVEIMLDNFVESINKINDNWNDYYKGVSDGQNVFEMALQDVGYFTLYPKLEEDGIDEEVKDKLFDIYKKLDCGGVE